MLNVDETQDDFKVDCERVFVFQERTGVKMIMIQDDPTPNGSDKPLRITGDPYKVQVWSNATSSPLHFSRFTRGLLTTFITMLTCFEFFILVIADS